MTSTPSPSGKLHVTRDGPVTTIMLNRPDVHNALDKELSAELHAAVRDVDRDRECRVMVLRGAGNTFCAGDDVKGMQDFEPGDGLWEIRLYQQTANLIDDLVPVTIAAVDGVCMGGGLELTLVCDFVVATDRSRWGMPEINWDITPGWGGTGRLTKFAGRRKTKEWNLLGNYFSATVAERHDLVNRICTAEELDGEVQELTEILLSRHPQTTTVTKYFVDKAADLDMRASLDFEGAPQRPTGISGIRDFADVATRNERRRRSMHFWGD